MIIRFPQQVSHAVSNDRRLKELLQPDANSSTFFVASIEVKILGGLVVGRSLRGTGAAAVHKTSCGADCGDAGRQSRRCRALGVYCDG